MMKKEAFKNLENLGNKYIEEHLSKNFNNKDLEENW